MTRLLYAIVLSAFFVPSASADIVRFTFHGLVDEVNGVPDGPWDIVQTGDDFRLTYFFDSETPDQDPASEQWGIYPGAILNGNLRVGPLYTPVHTGDIEINYWGSFHEYTATFETGADATGTVYLHDSLEVMLNSDGLESEFNFEFFSIADLFEHSLTLQFQNGAMIVGSIQSFESSVIPSPSGAIVVLSVLGLGRRKRLQR